jgi:hypothetical protein
MKATQHYTENYWAQVRIKRTIGVELLANYWGRVRFSFFS